MLPTTAFAQSSATLPDTAEQGLGMAALILTAFGGMVASMATDWLKSRGWRWLNDDIYISKINGWVSQFITGLFSILAGIMINELAKYAIDLDSTGIWHVVLVFGPWIVAEIRHRWRAS